MEKVGDGGYSYLITWPGSNPSLNPALLIGHTDVVPVDSGTEQDWTYPPFSGTVADGFIWGEESLLAPHCVVNTAVISSKDLHALLCSHHTKVSPSHSLKAKFCQLWYPHVQCPRKGLPPLQLCNCTGRGALDLKVVVVGWLEAAAALLREGTYHPERTLLLAFGHDEEVSGFAGAGKIAGRVGLVKLFFAGV